MILILHGDNATRSRTAILGLQKKLGLDSRVELLISNTSPQMLYEACMSYDIFGNPPFVVFDITGYGRTNLEVYLEKIAGIPTQSNLIIYCAKKLLNTNIFIKKANSLNAKVVLSEEPVDANIFKFVDATFIGDRQQSYKELRKLCLAGEDSFRLFSTMLYGLRSITQAKLGSPLLSKLPPFVQSKAGKQAEKFTDDSILDLYSVFYKIDKDMKVGNIPTDLAIPFLVERIVCAVKNFT